MSAPTILDSAARVLEANSNITIAVNTMTPTDPQSADNSIEMGDVAHVAGVPQTDPTMDGADNPGLGKPQIERCSSLG